MSDHVVEREVYSAKKMNGFIGGKHQGGIRYSGTFPELNQIGLIIGGGEDAIYGDEIGDTSIRYIGEGQAGDQKLAFGNRALVWAHFTEMQVHVFIHEAKNRYRYLGPHTVAAVSTSIEPDANEADRGVFVFTLEARP